MGQDGARRNRFLRSAAEVAGYHPKSSDGAGLQTVDVEDAVEVIGLMLEYDGGEAADRVTDDGNGRAPGVEEGFHVGIFDNDLCRAEDISAPVRNREAAFRAIGQRVGSPDYAHVGIDLKRFSRLIEALHGDDASVEADLRSGYADAVLRRVRHCRDHPSRQLRVTARAERPG